MEFIRPFVRSSSHIQPIYHINVNCIYHPLRSRSIHGQIRSYDSVACLMSEPLSDDLILPRVQTVFEEGTTAGEAHRFIVSLRCGCVHTIRGLIGYRMPGVA